MKKLSATLEGLRKPCTACSGVGTISCADGVLIVKKICLFCGGEGKR